MLNEFIPHWSDASPGASWDLSLPNRIVFGWGRRREIGNLVRESGNAVVCVYGSRSLARSGVTAELEDLLRESGVTIAETLWISREPTVGDVDDAVRRLRGCGGTLPPTVLAFGGGAALDLAKAVAAMVPQPRFETVRDYLEGVGQGFVIEADPLPIFAVPTTAGTGSEATKNAVIASYDPPFKKSLRDLRLVPRTVLLDPELTVSCNAKITAESGMDAITQLFESYVSLRGDQKSPPFVQALCEQGLVMAWHSLAEAVKNPASQAAREKMTYAAFLSGVCLANGGLGMAHGVAPALGSICGVTHGAACALLLPITLRTNAEVCRREYARLARLILATEKRNASDEFLVERLIDEVQNLCHTVGVARKLTDLGVTAGQIPKIAAHSFGASMHTNPRTLTQEELVAILLDA